MRVRGRRKTKGFYPLGLRTVIRKSKSQTQQWFHAPSSGWGWRLRTPRARAIAAAAVSVGVGRVPGVVENWQLELERTLKIIFIILIKARVGGTARDTKNDSFLHARVS